MEATTNTEGMVPTMNSPNPRELASILLMALKRVTTTWRDMRRTITKENTKDMETITATTTAMDTTNTRNMVTMLEHLDSTDMDKCMATTHCMDITAVVTDIMEVATDTMPEDTTVVAVMVVEAMPTAVIMAVMQVTMGIIRLFSQTDEKYGLWNTGL